MAGKPGIDGRGESGLGNMKASGATLDVKYGKDSSAPSCTNCPTSGGGQFDQDLGQAGRSDPRNATTLYLRYRVRFPANFDWGLGGKLPGLYGGNHETPTWRRPGVRTGRTRARMVW
ncbi:polysaccharide lyase [Kibdelosporangium phytohabitans]|uniref:polysaccharide lyase n=1 Tax=Kibdelosporangium phytohabitans TaxID=860235 RepID=UPI0012F927F4|nr:hypothetical protein [Kibdelosporangium phytohabitans]MBE1460991.1 hypothetical protein [Kibdelosporangium phytohabitans]